MILNEFDLVFVMFLLFLLLTTSAKITQREKYLHEKAENYDENHKDDDEDDDP